MQLLSVPHRGVIWLCQTQHIVGLDGQPRSNQHGVPLRFPVIIDRRVPLIPLAITPVKQIIFFTANLLTLIMI